MATEYSQAADAYKGDQNCTYAEQGNRYVLLRYINDGVTALVARVGED